MRNILKKGNDILPENKTFSDTASSIHSKRLSFKDKIKSLSFGKEIIIFLILVFLFLATYLSSVLISGGADFLFRYVSAPVNSALCAVTSFVPFSLSETLTFTAILLVFSSLVCNILLFFVKSDFLDDFCSVSMKTALYLLYFFIFCYIAVCIPCNHKTTLSDNLSMSNSYTSYENIYECFKKVSAELSDIAADSSFTYDKNEHSCMPMSFSDMDSEINKVFAREKNKYPFLSNTFSKSKKAVFSNLMTRVNISGIYSPFTGEANINIQYPDFVKVFSTAHEKAHQKGLLREDDANFMAFLVLYESDNTYFRYSALMTLYNYLFSAVYDENPADAAEIFAQTNPNIKIEMISYSNFFIPYRNTAVSNVSSSLSNVSLKAKGPSDGFKTYNNIIYLASEYLLQK